MDSKNIHRDDIIIPFLLNFDKNPPRLSHKMYRFAIKKYDLKKIIIRKGKEVIIKRKHPWIFSGAIYKKPKDLDDGDLVEVVDYKDQWLAMGHYNNGSIAIRVITFNEKDDATKLAFWVEKIKNAYEMRSMLGVFNEQTNAYRLIHAEGDGLPGLIVDIYGGNAVVQFHSIGMYLQRNLISKAIQKVLGKEINSIYNKSKNVLPKEFAEELSDGYLFGKGASVTILENNNKFKIDWEGGQKTGFFLDQRENRQLLAHYSKGKSILNAFCYTGGFSIYALNAGADKVTSIDISETAMNLVDENVAINKKEKNHQSITANVMEYLKTSEEKYDIVVVDPPAFAKTRRKSHNAVQAYKRLNIMAMAKIKSGGMLFTFSCSQVISRELFYHTIVSAAMESNRNVRIVHHLSQGPDHPVSAFHPEGSYLKGLVLVVD